MSDRNGGGGGNGGCKCLEIKWHRHGGGISVAVLARHCHIAVMLKWLVHSRSDEEKSREKSCKYALLGSLGAIVSHFEALKTDCSEGAADDL
ncbi:unnamed protein product [Cercopithifilaria johnstoni]|uniref:Uncharacterized protein n=1 Tax=Cercopithifilaria johnstoni TaxID=2874296 RepID=A0A8J2M553_9BILA|nr:unnamed protein product [Cercopithifilaria johnstoni]